jgi:DNA-binding response OmpR family regulator
MKILLLETDRQLAKLTADFFSNAGHDLICFSDPQSAVRFADINKPDLAIISLVLAGRSGIEFLFELRSYPDWQDIPVLLMGSLSESEMESYADSLKELDVSGYINRQTTSLKELLVRTEDVFQPSIV